MDEHQRILESIRQNREILEGMNEEIQRTKFELVRARCLAVCQRHIAALDANRGPEFDALQRVEFDIGTLDIEEILSRPKPRETESPQ